jgi:hypothetical protein
MTEREAAYGDKWADISVLFSHLPGQTMLFFVFLGELLT